jgi:hypothetical protein
MKKYIVITIGGFTEDDSHNKVENCQVIGKFYAPCKGGAIDEAYEIISKLEHDFDIYDLIAYELHPDEKI